VFDAGGQNAVSNNVSKSTIDGRSQFHWTERYFSRGGVNCGWCSRQKQKRRRRCLRFPLFAIGLIATRAVGDISRAVNNLDRNPPRLLFGAGSSCAQRRFGLGASACVAAKAI